MIDRGSEAIACSLAPAALADRRALWLQLAGSALRERRATDAGVQLVYAASDETEQQLRRLARLESECCAFADWHLTRRGDELILDVAAGESAGVPAVRALFGAG